MADSAIPTSMRAWQYKRNSGGIISNLNLAENVPVPKPTPDQHLVQVLATALNPVDYKVTEVAVVGRLMLSYLKTATPGVDIVGRVITPATSLPSNLKPGQLVFGCSSKLFFAGGGLGEYVAAPHGSVAPLPDNVLPRDAVTVGVAGSTAHESLVPYVKEGDRVFINGGSGGTGVFCIQIAKLKGCHVTTTCSAKNVQLCKSLGADEVIDYTRKDVKLLTMLKAMPKFHHVVDNVGNNQELYWQAHNYTHPGAKFVRVGADPNLSGVAFMMKSSLLPGMLGGGRRAIVNIMAQPNSKGLAEIGEWMQTRKIKAVRDSTFEFANAKDALQRLKENHAVGKVVVKVSPDYEAGNP